MPFSRVEQSTSQNMGLVQSGAYKTTRRADYLLTQRAVHFSYHRPGGVDSMEMVNM